jgi:hypothetical protein
MNNTNTQKKNMVQKKHFLIFIITSFLTFFNQFCYAQVSTYAFNESISSYTPLITPTTAYSAPWDDHVSGSAFLAPIGFNFTYDGVIHTQCFISPNGFISFGIQPAPTNYLPLSTATSFSNGGTISALGIDLISGTPTDNIVFQTIGTAPNRTFVVQWTNARRKVALGNFNFQIRLNETTNRIQIVYGACSTSDPSVYNIQLGLRGVTNNFLQGEVSNRWQTGVNTNFQWFGRTISGTSNSNTVRTSATEFPNNGLLYTYTPSLPCATPTASPTGLTIGSTSVDLTSFIGNSFTAAVPAPTNYLVLRSTINVAPTNIDVPDRVYWAVNDVISGDYTVISTSNATNFTQTGLTPNTRYYYWIIPYNAGCLGGPFYRMTSIASANNATCIAAPTAISSSSVDGNSFIADWIGVADATDYRIDVSTTNTFATTLPAYTNFSTGGATSLILTGLNPLTTYYYRVRAVGLGCGLNSTTGTVTTTCGSFTVPYSQNFDTTPVATVPNCFVITDVNADANRWQVQNSSALSNPNAIHLRTNVVDDSDDWFILPGIVLSNSVTYRLKFKYSTTNTSFFTENLRIVMGTSQNVSSLNITLFNLANFNNTVYQTAIVDFTPAVSDVYFIGFQGFSFANQSRILIDDISVIVSPTCFEPTDIIVSSVGSTSATLSWTASVPVPSNGYEYFISTNSTQPSTLVTPTGSVGAGITTAAISSLSPATLYYVWVRGNCGPANKSEWSLLQAFNTDCSVSTLLPVVNGTLCGGGSATLSATASMGSTIEWFSDAAGTILVGTGPSFVTPTLFSNTTYYARSKSTGGVDTVGPFSPISQGGTLGTLSNSVRLSFSVNNTTTFQSIDIYPMVSGQNGVLTIRDASFSTIISTYNYTTNTSGGGMPQTIPLGLNLTPGIYFMNFDVMPAAGLAINVDSTTYPYASTSASILANDLDSTYFIYAYNWRFSNICRSLLTPVTATITPAPPLSFSSTSTTLCAGETSPLVTVSGFAAYNNFVWTPNTGISGSLAAGFTFTPPVTTTYSLVASQTSGGLCTSLITYTVNVNAEPPAISIVPSSANLCLGSVQPLNATLAAATPVVILSENFNGATNNWTTVNTSVGGTPAAASWTLRNSPYTPPGGWSTPISSNDASQYYFTDSYAQGFPSSNLTQTFLVSPVINLAGYSSVTLSFWQYLRYIPGNRARVESSIDGGVTWQTPPRLVQTVTQGTTSGFVNTIVNLNGLLGNSNVRLRFYFEATYDYCWAIDNISITGNLALEVTWSPATDLFFDAAATVPYIAGTPTATVYSRPSVTRTYTGTALGANGCFTNNTTLLTVFPSVIPGVLSSSQIMCSGFTPNNLVLTGSTGTIIRWEYANNATFSSGLTTIANTTTTLTSAAIGTFLGDRFYRVVFQNPSCPITYSNTVTISFYSTTWNGTTWSNGLPTSTTKAVFNGNFISTGNLQACDVEVLSGTVVFNANHTLTVQNDVRVLGGSLTFNNNASLLQINHLDNKGLPFSNTGNITYRRDTTQMYKFDYTYWSTPVSPQFLLNISPTSPSNLFFEFNAPTNSWQFVISPGTTIMIPGKGYICRAPINFPVGLPSIPGIHTANFIGVPNNGNYSLPISGVASQFNLLGNPYPSALSADAFLLDSDNAASIGGTLYFWTHNTPLNAAFQYTGSDYAIYNYLGGTGTAAATNTGLNNSIPNGKIASGQGFFAKGLTNGTASFKNSMRIPGDNNQFFRISSPSFNNDDVAEIEKHRYWLNISNTQGAFKQVLVGYIDSATMGLDRLFDGEMVDVGNAISLYTFVESTKLSIQGRPTPFTIEDMIPLGYKSTISSEFSISLYDFDGLFGQQDIYLEDRDLNIIHNLKTAPYTFTTNVGTFDNRFVIRYNDSRLGVDPVFNNNSVVIYKTNDNRFVINSGIFNMDEVKVFDVRGRMLLDLKDINATQTSFDGGLTNEVLLVQITTEEGLKVTKKVIR